MGLFSGEELDPRIAGVLINPGRDARRTVGKLQRRILHVAGSDRIALVAADERTSGRALAVAGQRVLVFGGSMHGSIANVADIDRATIEEYASVCLNELRLGFYFEFRAPDTANTVARAVNRLIITSRPRTVPRLYPKYYCDMLNAANRPATPANIAGVVTRTVFIMGFQAAVLCGQNGAESTFRQFVEAFVDKMRLEDQSNVVDEMVDWLWARNPGFHYGIDRQLTKWAEAPKDPQSFLYQEPEIDRWGEGESADERIRGAIEGWTTGFTRNAPGRPTPC